MTALADQDIATVAEHGAHVVHCPRSNMKLASGICPVQRLLDKGINVALGTDGAASNNRLNMFGELQTAALLAKLDQLEPTAVAAWDALEMATLGGARALGLEAHIGSVEPGKRADLIALDLTAPGMLPLHNPASQLVYATTGGELRWSWVDGRCLVADGTLQTLDLPLIDKQAAAWRAKLARFAEQGPHS
jgi:5-methylthioadenosine/S-adenosylhomocysteine deaminase